MVEGGQEKNVTWWAFEILSKQNNCYFFLFTENTLFSHIIYPTTEKSQETDINAETHLFKHTHEAHEKTTVGAYMERTCRAERK